MKSQYIIILTIIITLTASMLFLAKIEKNQREETQDFWSIYFITPLDTSDNRFYIDNKTQENTTFHYEISIDDEVKEFKDIEIPKNTRELIETKDFNNQNIVITVTNGEDKKEINKH